jgi:hypothetical protein
MCGRCGIMNIINIKEIEDCFDGSFIKEILFDREVTEEFIKYLGKAGELDYFPSFAKPFYKVQLPGKYIVKGVQGNKTARIILYRDNIEESQEYFRKYVSYFKAPITA